MFTCLIEACEKVVYARRLCSPHYARLRRYGDPEGGPVLKREGECSSEDCSRPIHASRLCTACYARAWRRSRSDKPVRRWKRLSRQEVLEIRRRYRKGSRTDGRDALAREFGVAPDTVTRALTGDLPLPLD